MSGRYSLASAPTLETYATGMGDDDLLALPRIEELKISAAKADSALEPMTRNWTTQTGSISADSKSRRWEGPWIHVPVLEVQSTEGKVRRRNSSVCQPVGRGIGYSRPNYFRTATVDKKDRMDCASSTAQSPSLASGAPPKPGRCRKRSLTPTQPALRKLKALRVRVPRTLKLYSLSQQRKQNRRCQASSPFGSGIATVETRHNRPLHLWRVKHVARWVSKLAPEVAEAVIEKKIDGKKLLNCKTKQDLLDAGLEDCPSLLDVLREIRRLQAQDVYWHVSKLRQDGKKVAESQRRGMRC
mmetsp:Transcript_28356/g.55205  ORF Transcript_28356/g.55205 Transcript_28356/m.55205 type:complete len:299 (+) Transcript_28356:39-935(+)|eukprot:CAMPEP_0167820268 /NCGR_PEP_ID=MMETSP0112_2-20121227/5975_1 /TAXON_ID=91324 /ORGANISM="Lotharella globosa, Strain CCCM811" /LENGTH=298 /DNA_ID=CAMNT_0007720763 /DNA_START=54 /DNA_END=950 /DNA_ORIENTATION=+